MYIPSGSSDIFLRIAQSLDAAIRTEVESLRLSYFHWLLFCTGIVALGIFMEVGEVWYETIDFFKRRSLEERYFTAPLISRREQSVPSWVKPLAAAGWLLIVAGVIGEGVAEGYVSWADGTLQTFNDIMLGAAQKEAAFALERAANANERAAELERRLTDRHITLEQRKKILEILAAQHGIRVSVTFITPSSSDAQEYSIEIGGLFHDAEWIVVPHPWLVSMDTPVHGFVVDIRTKGSLSKQKSLERTTLRALSVLDDRISVTHGGHDPAIGMNLDMIILVGGK